MEPLEDIADDSPVYGDPSVFSIRQSYPEPPPEYFEAEKNEKRAVEVCFPPPNAIFEPEERQRHFGILRYTVNNRFNKMMLIGGILLVLMILIIVGISLLIVFTVSKGNSSPGSTITTTTKAVLLPTTLPIHQTSTVSSTTTTGKRTSFSGTSTTPIHHTSTVSSTTATGRVPDYPCTPATKTTFLFSYSNDFSPSTVLNALSLIVPNGFVPTYYSLFASNRFDTVDEDEPSFYTHFGDFNKSIYNHLPDPSVGYPSPSTGSDVFKMIDRFLSSPVCGSTILVFVKRYPSETDIDELVLKVQKYNASITFIVSHDSSGGSHPETLYDLASQTNGYCSFVNNDNDVPQSAASSPAYFSPILIYSANPIVSGQGTIQLPDLSFSNVNFNYWFTMTIQNNGPMNVVNAALVTMSSEANNFSIGLAENGYYLQHIGNNVFNKLNVPQTFYNVILYFNYADGETRTLQIRICQDYLKTVNN